MQNERRRGPLGQLVPRLCLASMLIVVLSTSCGDGDATDDTQTTPPTTATSASPTATGTSTETPTGGDAIEVEAEDRSFDVETITVQAGSQVAIDFKSRDDVPHNFAVYTSGDATEAIFQGDLLTGPDAETTYTFQAPAEPGTYLFQCDVHPAEMNGDFVVQ
jgi:plastocyanin